MESAGRRSREQAVTTAASSAVDPTTAPTPLARKKNERGNGIPKFTVNLSLPPKDRYTHIAPQFQQEVQDSNLPALFDELVYALAGSILGSFFCSIAKFAMRRVYTSEETAELRGICKASGVPMHVLVAFNVLLDLLLGCSSGGVRVDEDGSDRNSHIVHFRTLDWGMDQLRKIVVELDFVRYEDGPIIATSVTYFGYVGVLTGVRKGLSMSLNFRPHHDRTTWRKRVSFRWHQAMVVLGFRQSIASVLRHLLLDQGRRPSRKKNEKDGKKASSPDDAAEGCDMETILSGLCRSRSTAAYLIFCTPQKTYIVEKDNKSALVRSSDTLLAAYNHDASDVVDMSQLQAAAEEQYAIGMDSIVGWSVDRQKHLDRQWQKRVQACRRKFQRVGDSIMMEDVMRLVKDREISNEETHYAVVMDPQSGKVLWRRAYEAE